MTATDPNANTFRPFRSVVPALGKLQANWTSSANKPNLISREPRLLAGTVVRHFICGDT